MWSYHSGFDLADPETGELDPGVLRALGLNK